MTPRAYLLTMTIPQGWVRPAKAVPRQGNVDSTTSTGKGLRYLRRTTMVRLIKSHGADRFGCMKTMTRPTMAGTPHKTRHNKPLHTDSLRNIRPESAVTPLPASTTYKPNSFLPGDVPLIINTNHSTLIPAMKHNANKNSPSGFPTVSPVCSPDEFGSMLMTFINARKNTNKFTTGISASMRQAHNRRPSGASVRTVAGPAVPNGS
jgi:hypothetical protein